MWLTIADGYCNEGSSYVWGPKGFVGDAAVQLGAAYSTRKLVVDTIIVTGTRQSRDEMVCKMVQQRLRRLLMVE